MKLSWRWLAELVDLSRHPAEETARVLTFHTAEVEAIHPYGKGLDGVLTGRVAAVRPHPQADRLRLCTVDTGDGAPREVVCGAPNVAEGQTIAYAPEGVTLPNGLTLTRRKIRGIESAGMICAEDELGLGTDHEGILVLPATTPVGIPVGQALSLPDWVFEISNTAITNRPDLWGHVGFARDLGAAIGLPLQAPSTTVAAAAAASATGAPYPVRIVDEPGCRRYVAVVLEGVANARSPEPVRRRLAALGQRSIDLLVDLTNLVMLEQGQPLHAFDLDRIPEGEIVVRSARAGERLTTLDGVERSLEPGDLLICSGDRPVALAGVMGAADSGVGPTTTRVLLESATFDAARIRRTASRLGLRSEASSRFEKSLDPEQAMTAALRFVETVLEHAPGSRVSRAVADAYPGPYAPVTVGMEYDLVRRRLGARISDAEVRGALGALGFKLLREEPHRLVVQVPSWRATRDVSCPEDLVEEVGRMRSYDGIVPVAPLAPMTPTLPSPARRLDRTVAAELSLDRGYVEAMAHAFYGAKDAARLGIGDVRHLDVVNPLSEEQDRLTLTTAIPLLRIAAKNLAWEERGRVWLPARLVVPGGGEGLPTEVPVAGWVAWDRAGGDTPAGALFACVVEDLRAVLERAGVVGEVLPSAGEPLAPGLPLPVWLHPGRSAVVRAGTTIVAIGGEVAPGVLRAFGIEGRAALAELNTAALLSVTSDAASTGAGWSYRPLHRFPATLFDVAVVVPRRTPGLEVARAIEASAPGHVRDVALFDEYEGPAIPPGTRSLAFACALYDADATLPPERADELRARVRRALEERGWKVRSQ